MLQTNKNKKIIIPPDLTELSHYFNEISLDIFTWKILKLTGVDFHGKHYVQSSVILFCPIKSKHEKLCNLQVIIANRSKVILLLQQTVLTSKSEKLFYPYSHF